MDDGTAFMPEWVAEHANDTQNFIFAELVRYLEEIVPGFSATELRSRVEGAFEQVHEKLERNVVTQSMEAWEKEIISTMIPPRPAPGDDPSVA